VQYEDLPVYYGLASAFVHVSTVEQWGLVVNEASAAGLPVLVSNRCGCAPELVVEGRNGWVLDPMDALGIASVMVRVSDDPQQAAQMGRESQKIVSAFSPLRFADGLASAVVRAREEQSTGPSILDRLIVRLMALR
jgi:glycosyltransferase involved in cell wall biosynthesis